MSPRLAIACLALAGLTGRLAQAQVTLPGVRLPALTVPGLTTPIAQTLNDTSGSLQGAAAALRRSNSATLIRQNRTTLEADPNGNAMLRGQLVSINLTDEQRQRILGANFTSVQQQTLDGLDTRIEIWRAPPGLSTRRALNALRALAPQADIDYDHLYSGSGEADAAPAAAAEAVTPPAVAGSARVGLIDSGVAGSHPALRGVRLNSWGCDGRSLPAAHGTAVASLLVGDAAPFHGAAPGAQLWAADIYCDQPTGGSIGALAAALGWLHAQQVGVINISLVGPDNAVLKQVISQAIAHGHLIVAAVGNDGPAAPPLYPAAYPGVVGVTAVDAQRHVLLEAERGAQVQFAAPGADMIAAALPDGYTAVRGTSFAAPLVAGLLAAQLSMPDVTQAQVALARLSAQATDLGARGRDDIYGIGLVGESLRFAPTIMQARSAALR